MSCCDSAPPTANDIALAPARDFEAWVSSAGGICHIDLMVPDIHCAGCISTIERAVGSLHGVERARVNFSTKRVAVDWKGGVEEAGRIADTITKLGYDVRPYRDSAGSAGDAEGRRLLTSLAVAGFAAGNVMLLSVSVWSGAELATRDLFHWLSALIALPTVIYAGRPFYNHAWKALRHGRLNMDVPISLAVLLAAMLSLYETAIGGGEAYFDAAVTLLFFLLVGRYLDHMMRARARAAISQLVALEARGATVIRPEGHRYLPIEEIAVGDVVMVAAGETIPVDGTIRTGETAIDVSLVTGESLPETARPGSAVRAGTLNLDAPVEINVAATGEDTFLADIVRLMEAAEQRKDRYVRLADQAARIYAPAVHLVALLTLVGWMVAGLDLHGSLVIAIAVLVITCPCALGLAVPAVQVVAAGALFRIGVMVKEGAALEKLAEIDTVVFDKTGTLTLGRPELSEAERVSETTLAIGAGLAQYSRHPLSKALLKAALDRNIEPASVTEISEIPGCGLEGVFEGRTIRLGSLRWVGAAESGFDHQQDSRLKLALSSGQTGVQVDVLSFVDSTRPDAKATISGFQERGVEVRILSGDREDAVAAVAQSLGVGGWHACMMPQDKVRHVEALAAEGRKVLVVGDGINDGPMLAAGYASIAPASASDVGCTAADFVFLGDSLRAVQGAWTIAKIARRLVLQNFLLAFVYNMIAVPTAVLGFVSPLIAAIAMSSSSVVVIGNALRLKLGSGANSKRSIV